MPRKKDDVSSKRYEIVSKTKTLENSDLKILYEKGAQLFQFLFNKDYENVQTYLMLNPDLKEVIDKW
jgi:hypothetical protein